MGGTGERGTCFMEAVSTSENSSTRPYVACVGPSQNFLLLLILFRRSIRDAQLRETWCIKSPAALHTAQQTHLQAAWLHIFLNCLIFHPRWRICRFSGCFHFSKLALWWITKTVSLTDAYILSRLYNDRSLKSKLVCLSWSFCLNLLESWYKHIMGLPWIYKT